MPAITLTLTNAGRALLPANGGIAAVQLTQVGLTATAVVPNAGLTALAGEFKRLNTLSGAVTGPDTVSLGILDESTDTYDARAFGLYASTGELFAVFGQADPFVEKAAESNVALTIDIKFADVSAAELVFGDANFVIPAATTTVQGVIEIATDAEVAAKTDAVRAVTPKGLWFAFSAWIAVAFSDVWRSTNDGSGSGLDADLLDGQHGSYYANIPGRLGYTPANRAGDTFTGAVKRDNHCYLDVISDTPTLNLDVNDYLYFERANNLLGIVINGAAQGWVTNDGIWQARVGFKANGNTVWNAGNDGSGSALDADLLDGQEGSYYANIPERLGYTPANRAGDTFTGAVKRDNNFFLDVFANTPTINLDVNDYLYFERANNLLGVAINGAAQLSITDQGILKARVGFEANGNTVWNAGNDGSGSGLDADLLDGQDGSYYANIPERLGYTPLNQTAYTAADVLAKLLTVDGSGSGIDADMLDGKHASEFMLASSYTSGGDSNSGWRRGPDGFTEQWVRIMCSADDQAPGNWPRAFSSIMDVQATAIVSATNVDDSAGVKTFDNNGFTVIRTAPTGNRENNYIRVRACGYTATPNP